jgi:predicted  nucleic acid-binding Zn-ribbon protein
VTAFEALLALQQLDTTADQLRHRREHLPERAELVARHQELAALERSSVDVQAQRDQLAIAEKELEDAIAAVRAKAAADDKALYGGTVSAIKDLRALQDEIESLGRRQLELEDRELEIMEQAEPMDAELARIAQARADADAAAIGLVARIAELEVEIDGELEAVAAQRGEAAAPVAPELLSEYESLRKPLRGIAVARLIGTRCDGCHLTLSAVDVDRIRHEPPDALVHCSECGRILVR